MNLPTHNPKHSHPPWDLILGPVVILQQSVKVVACNFFSRKLEVKCFPSHMSVSRRTALIHISPAYTATTMRLN